jgi:protein-S-isoprenylcysteine O-methyltransferase Ste14
LKGQAGESLSSVTKRGLVGVGALVLVLWLVLFLPAWSLDYWQAWVYWAVFSVSVSAISAYFLKNDPSLVESRLNAGPVAESDTGQKLAQAMAGVLFILLFVISALDHHFGWSNVPRYLALAGDVFVVLGLLTIFLVFRENTYASVIIEVRSGQRVISTGPYRIVRHPMYSGALLMLLFTPIALGSFWAVLAVIPMFGVMAFRLAGEERFLTDSLPGYDEYCKKTRSRLVPFVW